MEGIYESQVPLLFRALMELGCMCNVYRHHGNGDARFALSDLKARPDHDSYLMGANLECVTAPRVARNLAVESVGGLITARSPTSLLRIGRRVPGTCSCATCSTIRADCSCCSTRCASLPRSSSSTRAGQSLLGARRVGHLTTSSHADPWGGLRPGTRGMRALTPCQEQQRAQVERRVRRGEAVAR